MKYSETRAVVETGFLTAVIMVLTIIGTNIPLMGFLSSIVVPTTVAVVGVRHGVRWSILAVIGSTIALSFLLSPMVAFAEGLTFALPGALVGYGFSKHWGLGRLVGIPAVVATVATVLQIVGGMYLLNIDYVGMWESVKSEAMKNVVDMYTAQGMTASQLQEMTQNMQRQIEFIGRTLLTACFAAMGILSYLTCRLTAMVLRRTGSMDRQLPGLSRWRMPVAVLYIYILGLLLMYWGDTRSIEWLSLVSLNMWWIGGLLLALQGLACGWSLCKSYRLGPVLRTFLMAMLFVMQMTAVILGALDILLDCRNRFAKRSE